jgi:uncharacterized protein YfaP (DUF2135 family)
MKIRSSGLLVLVTAFTVRTVRVPNATDAFSDKHYKPSNVCLKLNESSLAGEEYRYDQSKGDLTLDICYNYCMTASKTSDRVIEEGQSDGSDLAHERRDYTHFLVSQGTECVCADMFFGETEPMAKCDTPCAGDAEENCGGASGFFHTYMITAWVEPMKVKECGPPPVIPNSNETCGNGGGEDHPPNCNVTCNPGYVLKQNTMMCDTAIGEWFGRAECAEVTCGIPQPIANAQKTCITGTGNNPECAVECLAGFTLSENSLKCEQQTPGYQFGMFTGGAECAPNVCGPPPNAVSAMWPHGIEVVFPHIVQFTCVKGFTLDASPTGPIGFEAQCLLDGHFSDLPNDGVCKPVECGAPPAVPHGYTEHGDVVVFQQAIEYKCDEGHYVGAMATGPVTVTSECTATGEFAPNGVCEPVICGASPQVAFAQASVDMTVQLKLNDAVTFTCDNGHATDPRDHTKNTFTATCGPNGVVDLQGQGCHPVACKSPKAEPKTSSAEGAELIYENEFMYTCDVGHSVDGTAIGARGFDIICQADGGLTEPAGCQPIKCPAPTIGMYRQLKKDAHHHFGESIVLACNDGYSVDGTGNLGAKEVVQSCMSTGQWSPVPDCIEIDDCIGHTCGPFGECVDQHMDYSCECLSGYQQQEMDGEKICGNIDDCGPEACGPGECEDLVNDYTCHCPTGHELIDTGNKTCEAVVCGFPPEVRFTAVDNIKYSYEETVTYTCDVGTTVDGTITGPGEFTATCNAQMNFDQVAQCKKVTCGPPPSVADTEALTATEAVYNDTLTYKCKPGHSTDGAPEGEKSFAVGCLATGQYGELAACERITCGAPPPLFMAVIDATPLFFEGAASYVCQEGHSTDGSTSATAQGFEVTCDADGSFGGLVVAGTAKECTKVSCGKPKEVEHATAHSMDGLFFGDHVMYDCEEGFTQDGTVTGAVSLITSCEATSQLTEVPDKCLPVACEMLEIADAKPVLAENDPKFGDEAKYACTPGYAVESTPTDAPLADPSGSLPEFALSCLANGQLTPPPLCKNIDNCKEGHTCGAHGVCVDLVQDYTCDCEAGFELRTTDEGDKVCGNVDDCADNQCGAHGTCVDFIGGYTCHCQPGYDLLEIEDGAHSTCDAKKCGMMPEYENATTSSTGMLSFPESAQYLCKEGHSTDGFATAESGEFVVGCTDAGNITTPVMGCMAVTCGVASAVPYASVGENALVFGQKTTYTCDEGTSTNGEANGEKTFEIECKADGLFSLPKECAPVSCGVPPSYPNAAAPTDAFVFPAAAAYTCEPGFSLDGSALHNTFSRGCLADGTYAALPADAEAAGCKKVECGPAPEVPNSEGDASGESFGDQVVFKCNERHTSNGALNGLVEFSSVCQPDGTWSPMEASECLPIMVSVRGQVRDATSNAPIGSLTVSLVQHGVEKTATTDGNGMYSIQAELGSGDVKAHGAGYIDSDKLIFYEGDVQSGPISDLIVSPVLPPDGYRVVLTWGDDAGQRDLDSHLQWGGPRGQSCKTYWARRSHTCTNGIGSSLDVDDTNGEGPETTTMSHVDSSCTSGCELRFKVHNYTGRRSKTSPAGATVKLYHGDTLAATFESDSADSAPHRHDDWWDVFTLNAQTGEVTPGA